MSRRNATALVVLAGSVLLATSLASASITPTPPEPVIDQGKLTTDGVLTVGGTETVTARGLPAKIKLRVEVIPPPAGNLCAKPSGFCSSAPIAPAPGTPRFRTNGKGRATLSFVVPDHYDFIRLKDLTRRHPQPLLNGQTVSVIVSGSTNRRIHGEKRAILGIADAKAVIEVAQPTPSA